MTRIYGKSDYEEGKYNAYDEVAQIVNQLAEEYNNESVKGNLINRSSVIDVMWDVFNQYCNDADRFDEYETEAINRAFKLLQSVIEKQPTTNDSWIPCGERLPKKKTWVLVTRKSGVVDIEMLSTKGWIGKIDEVIAWCELPAPYQPKGE